MSTPRPDASAPRGFDTARKAPARTLILRVTSLRRPSVYREIEVGSSSSLFAVGKAIVDSFDFAFDHCFGFYSSTSTELVRMFKQQPMYELFADIGEPTEAMSVKKTRIGRAFSEVGREMTFLFDYGDEWLFRVRMTGTGEKRAYFAYPRLLRSVGKAPAQYAHRRSWR